MVEPAPTINAPEVPRTLQALNAWVNTHFHCMMGPPRAYFELPRDHEGAEFTRARYVVLAFREVGSRSDLEIDLVASMHALLSQAYLDLSSRGFDMPLLFWRRILRIEEAYDIDRQAHCTTISCRVWIPGANLEPFDMEGK